MMKPDLLLIELSGGQIILSARQDDKESSTWSNMFTRLSTTGVICIRRRRVQAEDAEKNL